MEARAARRELYEELVPPLLALTRFTESDPPAVNGSSDEGFTGAASPAVRAACVAAAAPLLTRRSRRATDALVAACADPDP